MTNLKSIRVIFNSFQENILHVEDLNGNHLYVLLSEEQILEIDSIRDNLYPGNVLNLLNLESNHNDIYSTEIIIFEPDYLIDISTLAECFRLYGNHPLNYILTRFHFIENSKYILLGNTANFFLDELINEHHEYPIEYNESLMRLFKEYPLEFTSCKDLINKEVAKAFFDSCKLQFSNIRKTIKFDFKKKNIYKEKSIIEPSFISNFLGLQGRLDLLSEDLSFFIELKSGKGIEKSASGIYSHSAENHYTQMILYLAVLEFNMNINPDETESFLFYSKYPVLSSELHSRKQLKEALNLRNKIVYNEFVLQKNNNIKDTSYFLSQITPERLNTKNLSGKFYENYLKSSIETFQNLLQDLSELEKSYFFRLYNFIIKELWISKCGERDYEGIRRPVNLWNASLSEKIEVGEILFDLKILDNQSFSERHYIDFFIPYFESEFLSNFRQGDAIVLYERNSENDTVNNKQIFKGAIEYLSYDMIRIRLRTKQTNKFSFSENSKYAIEHDHIDSTYNSMFRSLYAFLYANKDRRELLLLQRFPEIKYNSILSNDENNDDIIRITNKAIAAKDCFILVGPPGTGKTSVALKKITEKCIQNNENILLLSYTNRAVDEICESLITIDNSINFIRIGNELNCSVSFRSFLLENRIKDCSNRMETKNIISECSIFVGTIASIWNKQDLFNIKVFDTAIIDEATQLLEPHLLGILCAKNYEGKNIVSRFIMIGDYKQLPAVILQPEEDSKVTEPALCEIGINNLNESLFERLFRKYKENDLSYSFDMLTTQGRMHPEIADFPSLYFYNNKLKCLGLKHQKECIKYYLPKSNTWTDIIYEKRLAFISCKISNKDNFKTNDNEACLVSEIIHTLLKNNITPPDSIGIITPYRSQVALIRKRIQEIPIKDSSKIIIDTVERFQGSQKDIIIYSFCVNSEWQLSSLPKIIKDENIIIDRKLNVILTRARKQLFIIGNELLLNKNKIYNDLISHIRKKGTFIQFP